MPAFAVLDSSGTLVRAGFCAADEVGLQAGAGQTAHPIPVECIAVPDLNLAPLRLSLWGQVKSARAAAIAAGAPTILGAVQTDPVSLANITMLATRAMIAKQGKQAGFKRTFTKADDTEITLDAEQLIALATSVEAYVNACHDRCRVLRAEITTAANMADLLTIDITAGWPSNT